MAYDAFLKIDGINGESKDSQHHGWIEISSFSWDAPHGGGAKLPPGTMTLIKLADTTTPALLTNLNSGHPVATAILAIRKTNNLGDYLQYTMKSVSVLSLSHQGNRNGDVGPLEQIELRYGSIELTVAQPSPP